jgi:hypothetical protein
MKKTKILPLAALAVLLLTSVTSLSVFATAEPTFTLNFSSKQLQYVLPQGTTFNGTISTTGSVRFWVNAPNEAQIVNLGIIDKTTTFSFLAKQNGTYKLNFENDMPNSIQVTFSYTTDPQIPTNDNSTGLPLTYILIPIIIAGLIGIFIISLLRRKNKIQTSTAQNAETSNQ